MAKVKVVVLWRVDLALMKGSSGAAGFCEEREWGTFLFWHLLGNECLSTTNSKLATHTLLLNPPYISALLLDCSDKKRIVAWEPQYRLRVRGLAVF
eukprot:1624607-Rhodomonas_salina.1